MVRYLTENKKVKTTLFVSKDVREKIKKTGLSLEEYFEKIFKQHEMFSMEKWKDGVFTTGFIRICLLRSETINLILDQINEDRLLKVAREIGSSMRQVGKTYLDIETTEELLDAENRLSGWGLFSIVKNTIVINRPITHKTRFLQGYLELASWAIGRLRRGQ